MQQDVRVLYVEVVAADTPLDVSVVTLLLRCAQIGERPTARSGAGELEPGQAPELRSAGS